MTLHMKPKTKNNTVAVRVDVSYLGMMLVRNVVGIGLVENGHCSL